jgi:hypothetical protein
MIRIVHPGSRIRIFYPSRIPDPGVKNGPDTRSTTLLTGQYSRIDIRYLRGQGTVKDECSIMIQIRFFY